MNMLDKSLSGLMAVDQQAKDQFLWLDYFYTPRHYVRSIGLFQAIPSSEPTSTIFALFSAWYETTTKSPLSYQSQNISLLYEGVSASRLSQPFSHSQ